MNHKSHLKSKYYFPVSIWGDITILRSRTRGLDVRGQNTHWLPITFLPIPPILYCSAIKINYFMLFILLKY